MLWPGEAWHSLSWLARHGIYYGMMGMAWYVVWPDGHGMVWPGGHGMGKGMAWRVWHSIWYDLEGMSWFMVWSGGHGIVQVRFINTYAIFS